MMMMNTPDDVRHAFSISGFLYMKQNGGTLAIWRPKRRFHFAIDEICEELIYHKSEVDFVQHREPLGTFPISTAVITLNENNNCSFILHYSDKNIELEAENEKSCRSWLNILSNRYSEADNLKFSMDMFRKIKHSSSLPDRYLIDNDMDDWVSHWLQNEKFQNCSTPTDPTTAPSTTIDSQTGSCSSSERADNDEIEHLREITNNQKTKIEELKNEMNSLTKHLDEMRKNTDLPNLSDRENLATQNKFLNSEILRISAKCEILELQAGKSRMENRRLFNELQMLRCDYVYAVQSTIRIPLHDSTAMDVMSMKLLGGDAHKSRLIQLMAEARQDDPSLPTLQSLLLGIYVDSFGFRVSFKDEAIALHYMATKLHQFYASRSQAALEHKKNWKKFLEEQSYIELNSETKEMCRRGIPNSLRATVWRILINQQVEDLKSAYGKYYFRNLCNTQSGEDEKLYSDVHQKQINLDLLRTMPSNVHFMSANSKGVTQLLQVLHAFCLHNPQIGYCQGMNFLAATALLFVGPEDAFWFLIAITERYFDKTYFDSNLTGAQADQEVFKELLEVQCPKIMRHLNSLDIDVASITLNWFIALFFDAVPFNTLLRIWDCFLLEGPKVLFRFAIVLIARHEEEITSRNDAIGIMRVSKAASRLAFDENAIVDLAFRLANLPSRGELKSLQMQYVAVLGEKLEKKTKRASAFVNSLTDNIANDKMITNLFVDGFSSNNAYVVSGHHMLGKVAKIKIVNDRAFMKDIDIEFDCRIMAICTVKSDMAYVSLVSGYVIAAHIGYDDEWSILWELKLPDVATFLINREDTLFAGLANGTMTVFENAADKWPTSVQMWHLPLSSSPLMNAVLHDDLLIVATACKLITLDAISLTLLSTSHVASSNTGSGVFYFDKITCLCESSHGIFLTTDHSTLIQLWNETTCNLLYDIIFDHKTRKPSLTESEAITYIESILFIDSHLWIGTSDGYVFVYSVESYVDSDNDDVKYRLKRFPNEKRHNKSSLMRSQKLGSVIENSEESDSADQVFPPTDNKKRASRVSINIDRETQQYSVSTNIQTSKDIDEQPSSSSRLNSGSNRTIRSPIKKGYSADSAVSVFSSDELIEKCEQEFAVPKKEYILTKTHATRLLSSTDSSCTSMEFDDTFELYSDEERSRRQIAIHSPKKKACASQKEVFLKRRDLKFDEPYLIPITDNNDRDELEVESCPVNSTVKLNLLMKLKISDYSVKRIVCCGNNNVLTCSGEFGADEAVLLWRKDYVSNIWINDPVIHSAAPSTRNSHTTPNLNNGL
ncbi:unnamed protein product [Caenorhabditis bovis]|uniref:TBC1 domain family member 2B n=1 Tax=Caenorhabditis bovis TaxID=2654633 RepID=A0A8S1EIJ1_9PELO|nr:unnamed protein product [Caenorhabditis bovis]